MLKGKDLLQYRVPQGHADLTETRDIDEKEPVRVWEIIINEIDDRAERRAILGGRVQFEKPATEMDADANDHTVCLEREGKEVTRVAAVS